MIMKTKIHLLLFAISVTLLYNCSYEFQEDSFNDINLTEPNANISLTGFINGEETISSKTVQYNFTGISSNEFEVIVKVDQKEIHRNYNKSGEFYLYIDELSNGQHELTFEYIFPTNSGSLADNLNGEFFTGTNTYNFSVDKSLAEPFGIEKIDHLNGSIYITLKTITDPNFDEAILVIKNEHDFIIEERPISSEDLQDLKIHDNKTVTYNPSFAIKVKNAFAEKTSQFVLLPTEKMTFKIEPLTYSSFKLIYNSHPFYGNFENLTFDYTYKASGSKVHSLNPQGGETIIPYGYYFGESFYEIFKLSKPGVSENLHVQLQVGNNLPITNFKEIFYVKSINKYFAVDVNNSNDIIIYQLKDETFEIEKSKTITSISFSTDFNSAEYDYSTEKIIINLNEKSIVFDPISFNTDNTYIASDFDASKSSSDVYYRGNYVILEEPWFSGEVSIFEISTGVEKFKAQKTTSFFSAIDASHFYANGGIYKLESGEFNFQYILKDQYNNTPTSLDIMAFDKQSNSAIYHFNSLTYYLDLSDYNQTNIYQTAQVFEVSYTDEGKPFINSDHYSAGNKSHIYDAAINDTRLIDTFAEQSYRYINGYIFSPNGFYFKSNLYTN